ncbi:MAG TPA: hypothetical protein VEO01_41845, partial [Pseudonocardiaceae bacterium]|nr:hypothetical protein [Pseudonocardiaceae bacterium]
RHLAWTGQAWTGWEESLGHPAAGLASGSSLAMSSRGVGGVDVLALGADAVVWHSWWTGTGWAPWESTGPGVAGQSSPTVASMSSNRLDLFTIGPDGNMRHTAWIGGVWGQWDQNEGHPAPGIAAGSAPALSSWGVNRLDLFVRGTDNAVDHAAWQGGGWPWESRGPAIMSAPTAVSWSTNHIDLFGIGQDSNVWHQTYGDPLPPGLPPSR